VTLADARRVVLASPGDSAGPRSDAGATEGAVAAGVQTAKKLCSARGVPDREPWRWSLPRKRPVNPNKRPRKSDAPTRLLPVARREGSWLEKFNLSHGQRRV